MKSYLKFLALTLVALTLVACGGDEQQAATSAAKKVATALDTNTPDGAFKASIAAIRNNDLKALVKTSLTDEQYKEVVAEFEKAKQETPSEEDEAQFQQMMQMLTADGAEETLYAMAEPQLEQARAMLPMLLMMGKDQAAQAIQSNEELPEAQKESAVKISSAAIDWLSSNDILGEESTKKAIAAAVATAKQLDIKSLKEINNMSFDQALEKGSVALGGVKNVLNAYGLSIDDALDSVKLSNVKVDGDKATMDMTMSLFGEEIPQVVNLIKKDGKWVSDK